MRKNISKISRKNENYANKTKISRKMQNFQKTNAKFQRKSCENSSKKLKFLGYKAHFQSPINGLTQNINKDLRTTRRKQTIHKFA